MGFNRRKMEDRRRQAAEKEAAARRATERQILEDAEHLITVCATSGRPSGCRRCSRRPPPRPLLVPTGALPGLQDHRRCRPADARLEPRRGRDGLCPCAVSPLLPAERPVR